MKKRTFRESQVDHIAREVQGVLLRASGTKGEVSGLAGGDGHARGEVIAGMEEDALTGLEAGTDDGLAFSAVAKRQTALGQGRVVGDDIARPVLLPPEEGAQRDEEGAGSLAEDDPGLDAVGFPETGSAGTLLREEVSDDIDALLLDAERGESGEGSRFQEADGCVEGLVTAPAIDDHPGTGADLYCIGREDFDDQLEVGRVADLKDGSPRRDDPLALLVKSQDATSRGGPQQNPASSTCLA